MCSSTKFNSLNNLITLQVQEFKLQAQEFKFQAQVSSSRLKRGLKAQSPA